jgi:acetate kinase
MKVFIINSGSSSVKYQLLDPENQFVLAKGTVSRIGMSGALLDHQRHDGKKFEVSGEILDHTTAIEYVIDILLHPEHGVIRDKNEIAAVGHRVVHGGEKFSGSVIITPEVIKMIQDCIKMAPLHNPHNLRGINACLRLLPGVPQIAVFDTAFHSKMEEHTYIYGIPYELYERHGIRRYGFHGTSHYYVSRQAYKHLGMKKEDCKVITCHLGNGCSMAAVDRGTSVDTTMGFTPLEGLLMGTRCGDIDPSIPMQLMSMENLGTQDVDSLLNKHSGLKGISGEFSDMRDIVNAMNNGNKRAKLAFEVFCYRIRKYIGAYTAVMGGVDAIIFTGGIGENARAVRAKVCENFEYLGLKFDPKKNENAQSGVLEDISTDDSKVKILVIPTNEELVIAIDTMKLVQVK